MKKKEIKAGTINGINKIMSTAKKGCKFEPKIRTGGSSGGGKYNDPDILYWFMAGGRLTPVRRDGAKSGKSRGVGSV